MTESRTKQERDKG